jgi:hypothetical protein
LTGTFGMSRLLHLTINRFSSLSGLKWRRACNDGFCYRAFPVHCKMAALPLMTAANVAKLSCKPLISLIGAP